MTSQISYRLKNIVATHGLAVVRDPQRVEELLRTAPGRDSKGLFLIMTTLRAGVVTQLLSVAPDTPIDATIDRLAVKMHRSRALVKDSARWAVATWAAALGLIQSVEQPCPHDADTWITDDPATEAPKVQIATTAGLGRIACPNCKTPLIARPSENESEPVECPCCFWRFEIHGPTGEIMDDGSIEVMCPYKSCGAHIVVLGGQEPHCRRCGGTFSIDGRGNLRGFPEKCPTCNGALSCAPGEPCISCLCNLDEDAEENCDGTIAVDCPLVAEYSMRFHGRCVRPIRLTA